MVCFHGDGAALINLSWCLGSVLAGGRAGAGDRAGAGVLPLVITRGKEG